MGKRAKRLEEIIRPGSGIYRFRGSFANIYVLNLRRCIMIVDMGFLSDAVALFREIAEVGLLKENKIFFLVPTHSHPDHAEGLSYLAHILQSQTVLPRVLMDKEKAKARVEAPPRSDWLHILEIWWKSYRFRWPRVSELWGLFKAVRQGYSELVLGKALEPILYPEDGEPIPQAEDWIYIYTSNHSEESICLHNPKEKILITGDTILNELGKGALSFKGSEAIQAVKKKLSGLEVEYILPGHGEVLKGEKILEEVFALKTKARAKK